MEKIYYLQPYLDSYYYFKTREEAENAMAKLNQLGFDCDHIGHNYICTSLEDDMRMVADISVWIYKDKIEYRCGDGNWLAYAADYPVDGFSFEVGNTLDDTKSRVVNFSLVYSLDKIKTIGEKYNDMLKEFANEALNRPSAELMEMSKEELHDLIAVVYEKKYKNFVL